MNWRGMLPFWMIVGIGNNSNSDKRRLSRYGSVMSRWIYNRATLSAVLHRTIYGDDHHMSLCARAWWKRDASRFWSLWVAAFGRQHCYRSWRYYYD